MDPIENGDIPACYVSLPDWDPPPQCQLQNEGLVRDSRSQISWW